MSVEGDVAGESRRATTKHLIESWAVQALVSRVARKPWKETLALGERLGEYAMKLGIRRGVAEGNLARAFPERSQAERDEILLEHYREVGRVAVEYPRLPELVRAPFGEVIAAVEGVEHLRAARAGGRGAIVMTGHFGNFELLGAWLAREHSLDFVVKPLSNPRVERMLEGWRRDAGVGAIPLGVGIRRIFSALAANRWVGMLADQDGRREGVFVSFLGQPSSTAAGPAEIALRTGAPIVMGFIHRLPDGRHSIRVLPPLEWPDTGLHDRTRALTAAHAACLEREIRLQPAMWFWLHRRWKTAPPLGWDPAPHLAPAGRA